MTKIISIIKSSTFVSPSRDSKYPFASKKNKRKYLQETHDGNIPSILFALWALTLHSSQ